MERKTKGEDVDPILKLARQLPRLPETDRQETERLSALIHGIVFVAAKSGKAGTAQALSDARHLAQAALARASGYVTSDGQVLDAREQLLEQIGIDVASLDEFAALLPVKSSTTNRSHLKGTDCAIKSVSFAAVKKYLEAYQVSASVVAEFASGPTSSNRWKALAVSEVGEIVGVGVLVMPSNIDAPARILVHVRPDHVASETFADHLIDLHCHEASRSGPITIEMPRIPGQTVVRRTAILRGFLSIPNADALIKVALGCPVTKKNWAVVARQTRRRTGLRLPENPPDAGAVQNGLVVYGPDGRPVTVRLAALEDAVGPTILVWPGRDGVVVPIEKNYADDLLGTGDRFQLFGLPEAFFVARRTYFNSPRTAALMRPGVPILFYESKRSGGRGAIVAAARIVDATVIEKSVVPQDVLRRAVVEDLEPISASAHVLATTFDNLLRFPMPISFETLCKLGAEGSSNLQTTTALSNAALSSILELGWSRV